VVLIVFRQLRDNAMPNGTTVALVAIGLTLVFALIMPGVAGQLLKGVSKVKVAGVEISFAEKERAERIQRRLPRREDDVKLSPRPRTGVADVDVLRVEYIARKRLRFVRTALLELPPEFDYVDILANLHEGELIDTDEAKLILDLLNEPVSVWPEGTREPFLDAAWPFALRLGALVWDRYVRKSLKKAGWRISEFDQKHNQRPDFLVFRNGQWIVAAARVARPWTSLCAARKRLAGDVPSEATRRVVIVPQLTNFKVDNLFPEVEIVPLPQMLEV
jgi:hypothetical protein